MSLRPSPLQNRSAPDGTLAAVPERGLMMGNRGGRLHRPDGTLAAARWRSRAWICCLIEFRSRHRQVMGPGYTEVFFLDDATALAAGHRPCFECRHAAARAFAAAWAGAHDLAAPPRAGAMDRTLHAQRLASPEARPFGTLPEGTIFTADSAFHLRTPKGALLWSFAGYRPARAFDPAEIVAAVTPPAIRAILAIGYRAGLHPSAGGQRSAR